MIPPSRKEGLNMSVRDFSIHVGEDVLSDLTRRIDSTRWPPQVSGSGWDYGADFAYVKELCEYWAHGYNWRDWEKRLNSYPQFISEIDGVGIHFWHIKGKGDVSFPLLLLHGWPGSAFEFFEVIDRLTASERGLSFDLVIPDLPGYGWSGKPVDAGWGADRTARALNALMTKELGYGRYGVQGGDWGGMIAARLGTCFPDAVSAIHLNFTILPIPMIDVLSEADMAVCKAHEDFDFREGAYHLIQETKCDAVSLAQGDSPAGLAAWILDKFRVWSDCGGELESEYTKDQLITNLMFYWAENSVSSAARMYYESFHNPALNWGAPDPHISVPTAVARFPRDPFHRPRGWMEKHFHIVRWTEMPRGGHFAALEEPELLAKDIRAFFASLQPAP